MENRPLLSEEAAAAAPAKASSGCCVGCCTTCCGSWGRKIWLGVFAFLVLFWCICEWENKQWEVAWVDDLSRQAHIADTAVGQIQYYIRGEAPYVMMVHGQMGGWDVCFVPLMVDGWIAAGYGLICPGRAGYLGSPLPSYPFDDRQQADLLAALLDTLEVDKVVVTGGSGGGPCMYSFAARHPERVVALIPLVAISGAKPETPESPMYGIDKHGNFPLSAQMVTGMMTDATIGRLIYWTMQDISVSLESGMVQMSALAPEQRKAEIERIMNNRTLAKNAQLILLTTVVPFAPRWPGNLNDIYVQTFLDIPLENISVPTLIVHDEFAGRNGVPLSYAKTAHQRIPNSELIIVKKAWHVIWLAENWGKALDQQIAFAKRAAGASGGRALSAAAARDAPTVARI